MTPSDRSLFWKLTWPATLVVLLGVALFAPIRWLWLNEIEKESENSAREFAQSIGTDMARGLNTYEPSYNKLIKSDLRIGYVAVSDFRSGVRSGVMNSASLKRGAQEVIDYLKVKGNEATLSRIVRQGEGFSGEYLNVFSVTLLPSPMGAYRTPLGIVKIGYIVPGFPYGRGYVKLWIYVSVVALLTSLLLLIVWVSLRPKYVPVTLEQAPLAEMDEALDELEEALDEESTSLIDEKGREWVILFDGKSLSGWKSTGDWYITEREIAGQPWRTSLVREDLLGSKPYWFQLRAKKLAGPDGFIFLFVCDKKQFAWVLGGWKNSRSELLGFEKTRVPIAIEKFRWYKIEVRVEEDKVEGWVEDQVLFSVPRTSLTQSSPEVGFQKGIGLAVWNTLAKFKEVRFLPL